MTFESIDIAPTCHYFWSVSYHFYWKISNLIKLSVALAGGPSHLQILIPGLSGNGKFEIVAFTVYVRTVSTTLSYNPAKDLDHLCIKCRVMLYDKCSSFTCAPLDWHLCFPQALINDSFSSCFCSLLVNSDIACPSDKEGVWGWGGYAKSEKENSK